MNSLFENPKPETRPAKAPGWVVRELIDVHGVAEARARAFPCKQAFAVLYHCRDRKAKNTPDRVRLRHLEIAQRLRRLCDDPDANPEELLAVTLEAMACLDVGPSVTVARHLVELLSVPPKTA